MCLLKTSACLKHVHFNVFVFVGNWLHAGLIQVACLIQVAIKAGFTVQTPSPGPYNIKYSKTWQEAKNLYGY